MRVLPFLLLLSSVAAAAPLSPPPEPASNAAKAGRYLAIRTEMGGFSGAVLIVRGGKVILRRGYGFADVEHRRPFTPDTAFEVASVSKMFTAMAALKLRDDGKLRLDDSICKYIEACPAQWQPITVQQLMRHTSGIPDYEEPLELGSPKYLAFMTQPDASAKIFDDAKTLPLDFEPGEKFHYSNTGYIVLGHVIEKAAGEPFSRYVTRRILRPAGMTHSGVLGDGPSPRNLAIGYTHGDLGWEKTLGGVALTAGQLTPQPSLPLTPPEGDAWLYSTVDDLARWSRIMEGGSLVPAAEASEVFTPGLGGYGYGWFIGTAFNRTRMRHTGSLPGYTTDFIRFPDHKLTIIVFANLDRARMAHIVRNLSFIALGMPYDMPVRGKVVQLDAAQYAALEGEYRMADGTTLTIRKEPDYLTAQIKGRYTAGLIPLSPTEFYFPLADGRALFTLGEDGKATMVNMEYSAEDHIAARVMPEDE